MSTSKNVPTVKLLVIGAAGVGKSALLLRYCDNLFEDGGTRSTIGVDLRVKKVNMNGTIYKTVLWDTAGQERYRTVTSSVYNGTHGILLVYDLCNLESFRDLDYWLNESLQHCSADKTVRFIVGSKRDKTDERQVSKDVIESYKKELEQRKIKIGGFYEVSAKNPNDVNHLFHYLVQKVIEDGILDKSEDEGNTVDLKADKSSISYTNYSNCSC